MQKEKAPNNRIRLVRLSEEHIIAFKEEMQEAFQHGFEAYNKDAEEVNQWQVLPDKDFYQSLEAKGAEAYEAVNEDHPDPNMPEQFDQEDGLFKFEKRKV